MVVRQFGAAFATLEGVFLDAVVPLSTGPLVERVLALFAHSGIPPHPRMRSTPLVDHQRVAVPLVAHRDLILFREGDRAALAAARKGGSLLESAEAGESPAVKGLVCGGAHFTRSTQS
jgi:hypothetical protein